MEFANVKPLKEYGFVDYYAGQPELVALLFLTSLVPFEYEGEKPEEERTVALHDIHKFKDTLGQEVGGVKVGKLLRKTNPMEFYEFIKEEDLSHLKLLLMPNYADALKTLIRVRAAAWASKARLVEKRGNMYKLIRPGYNTEDLEDYYEMLQIVNG